MNPKELMLPTEKPFKEGVKIYIKRLLIYATIVAAFLYIADYWPELLRQNEFPQAGVVTIPFTSISGDFGKIINAPLVSVGIFLLALWALTALVRLFFGRTSAQRALPTDLRRMRLASKERTRTSSERTKTSSERTRASSERTRASRERTRASREQTRKISRDASTYMGKIGSFMQLESSSGRDFVYISFFTNTIIGTKKVHEVKLIKGGKLVVGRAPESDILINKMSVSNYHAEIWFNKNGVEIRDLGSAKGTFLGKARDPITSRFSLIEKEIIWIGNVKVRVKIH